MRALFKNISLINAEGIRNIVREFSFIIICSLVLFFSAGTMKWMRAWIYISLIIILQAAQMLILIINNPELINERGKLARKGTKKYELIFIKIYFFSAIIISIVAGFDAMRYKWTALSFDWIYPGIVLFVLSSILGIWAMAVNPFFAATQRVQSDKNHTVITAGPYTYIRHPGYLSWILGALSYPLLLGSLLSFVVVFLLIVIFIGRTHLEDSSLQKELDGYREYARVTKYRLIPYVW
jgi:protein-S-isoprenylcysteine O-methyltransferase Ste14